MSPESKANFPISSLEGHLLIAAPRMDDPRFARCVLLVLKHNEDGAMGIILNRPVDDAGRLPTEMTDLFNELQSLTTGYEPVRIGGPVGGPIIALKPPSVRHGEGGVYLINGREQLQQVTEQVQGPFQFFVGHSAWTAGQLEQELESGYWLTLPADTDLLTSDHQQMWVNAIRETGRSVYRDVLGIRGFPQDVSMN